MKCKECNREFSSTVALISHIVSKHNKKNYYDKWIKSPKEGQCSNCENPTEFSNRWNRGYKKFCSSKCRYEYVNNQPEKIKRGNITAKKHYQEKFGVDYYMGTKEFQEKSKKTKLEKYGHENWTNLDKTKESWQKNMELIIPRNPH